VQNAAVKWRIAPLCKGQSRLPREPSRGDQKIAFMLKTASQRSSRGTQQCSTPRCDARQRRIRRVQDLQTTC
jgi:hypothetical protein